MQIVTILCWHAIMIFLESYTIIKGVYTCDKTIVTGIPPANRSTTLPPPSRDKSRNMSRTSICHSTCSVHVTSVQLKENSTQFESNIVQGLGDI